MSKKNILLIDDDCDDAEFFTAALSGLDENISLLCTSGGNEALEMLSTMEYLPWLILLDAGMPRMNGWECLRLLKENSRFKDLPVIMVATSTRNEGIDEARQLGAEGYLIKPSSYTELEKMMKIIGSEFDKEMHDIMLKLKTALPKSVHVFS